MTDRDRARLVGVHPMLVDVITQVLDEMEADGHPMTVVQGVRTVEEQALLYAKGRTAPGQIVTMKDGIQFPSAHQVRKNGWGCAVDCVFASLQPYDPRHPWQTYGEALESRSAVWGGRWSHPIDAPHAEWRHA